MRKFIIGYGWDAWSFLDAYNAAQDGDIIAIDKDITLNISGGYFNITKNIEIHGFVADNGNGTISFTSVIKGLFKISNGAKIVIKDLHLTNEEAGSTLFLTDKSEASLNRCRIEQGIEDTKYSLIYCGEGSKLDLTYSYLYPMDGYTQKCIINNGELNVQTSSIKVGFTVKDNSLLKLENTAVTTVNDYAIDTKKSKVILNNSTITGGSNEDMYPAILSFESTIETNGSTIRQKQFVGALYLANSSVLTSKNDDYSSILIVRSKAFIDNLIIRETFHLSDLSYVYSTNELKLMGERDNRIDLVIEKESALIGESIKINRIFNPNIRLINSVIYLDDINYGGDLSGQVGIAKEGNSRYLINSKEAVTQQASSSSSSPKEVSPSRQVADKNSYFDQLNKLVGLNSVKKEISKMLKLVDFNKLRKEKGLKPEIQTLHSVFIGNPGTGKTTVARLMGQILFDKGVLSGKEFKFVEAVESDLISSNVGGTAEQTQAILESARGGILFIDEAYTLNKSGNVNFGQEAINTILKFMEDNRDDIMIIFAGYTKEMEQFLETNPGLKSRVPNVFVFEDFTAQEITEMGESNLVENGYSLEDREYYQRVVGQSYDNSLDRSNGRWIRNFNEKLTRSAAYRIIEEDSKDLTIKNIDIDEVINQGKYIADDKDEDALEKLNRLIGIKTVKKQVYDFINLAELNKRREEEGKVNPDFTLHSLFLGNPGTGKTTVARIVGDVLFQKGIIKTNKFIEVSRSDLVAGYVGQTAIKTREVLKSALGGVLFIDEAYSLSKQSGIDFGGEAIEEILKFMEDYRKDIVIIFAGYSKEMADFISMNSGLASRIPNKFNFEDYSAEELVQIGLLELSRTNFIVDKEAYRELVLNNFAKSNDRSNGRWVRNLNERLIRAMSSRVIKDVNSDSSTILIEDLEKIRD